MSWITDILKRTFSSSAGNDAPEAPQMDPAHFMLARHKLNHLAEDPAEALVDWFVPARSFLTAIEHNAKGSSLNHLLGTTAGEIKIAARVALLNAVASGKTPFFYQKHGDKDPIHIEDMYVPVTSLAKHALALLDNTKSVTLPSIYLSALEGLNEKMHSRTELADQWHLDYVDLKDDDGESFELVVAKSRSALCPLHKSGPGPS